LLNFLPRLMSETEFPRNIYTESSLSAPKWYKNITKQQSVGIPLKVVCKIYVFKSVIFHGISTSTDSVNVKRLRKSFHLELFLTARLQLSPGGHVSDSSAALSSINFCGRIRTTSFCLRPGNSTHSSHTVLHWHSALIDAGLETNVHNSCYRRCRTISFHLKQGNSTHFNVAVVHWYAAWVHAGL